MQRFRECTIICPSWVYPRALFDRVASWRASEECWATEGGGSVPAPAPEPDAAAPESTLNGKRTECDKKADHYPHSQARAFVENSPELLAARGLRRVPEDLYFFLDVLKLGGRLAKVNLPLVTYRYSLGGWALGSRRQDLQRVRAVYLEAELLSSPAWERFSIWGA